MTTLELSGTISSAFDHFALFGLAEILDAESLVPLTVWWSDEANPRPKLDVGDLTPEQVAEIVSAHASAAASETSWVQARVDHLGRSTAAFSPRIKFSESGEVWRTLQTVRHTHLDALTSDRKVADLRLIGAMGEPAYWRFDRGEPRPDHGASRWEMKTRNRGEEFVGQRLALLADAVAKRTPAQTMDGLLGRTVVDEIGKNNQESRTPTGLTSPAPADNARAWCALWGISQFTLVQQVSSISRTAGAIPANRLYPKFMLIPVPTGPVTLARLRSVIGSSALAGLDVTGDDSVNTTLASKAALSWLSCRRIAAVMRFPIRVGGSASAPERYALAGTKILTRSTQ